MNTKTTLSGTFTTESGHVVDITKDTTVAYRYAVVLVKEETGEVLDVRFTKSYSNIESIESRIANDWGIWNKHYAPIYTVSLKRPTKFRVNGTFTAEQIALIEKALGTSVNTTDVIDAA
jgi:hypothetical protein